MTIDKMVKKILNHEGGFVDDIDDRGGATNFGITQITYSQWLGRPASVNDVRAMDIETAKEIYLTNYYFTPRINSLQKPVQPQVFDCSINHGPFRAIKFLQNVCNLAGFDPLIVDGVCGPKTRRTIETVFKEMGHFFINAVVDERIHFYHQIVENDASQNKFLNGWLIRAENFRVKKGEVS